MNQVFKMVGMLCLVLLLAVPSASAQSRKKKKDVDAAFNEKTMLSGLHLESGISLSYRNGWQIAVSPAAGYRLQKWLIVGAGVNYSYSERYDFISRNDKLNTTFIGPRAFVRANISNGYYGLLEYQYNTFKVRYKDSQGAVQPFNVNYCGNSGSNPSNCIHKHQSAFYLGGGMTQSFGQGFGIFSEIMLDVLYDRRHTPKSAPYEVRIGVSYTFL